MTSVSSEPLGDAESPSWRQLLRAEYLPKLALQVLAVWLHAANAMLTATVMPSVVADIGGIHLVSWAFALYLCGSIVAGASISLLVARRGLRNTLIFSTLLYATGCLICALASDIRILLTGRTVQGLGGGALLALVYISQDKFFPNYLVPKIVAVLSTAWMVSAFAGPLVGGAFATWGVWRLAFWIFVVKALILCLAIQRLLRGDMPSLGSTDARIPVIRLTLLASTILLFSWAGASFDPVTSPLVIVCGIGALILFVYRDRAALQAKMLPARIVDLDHPVGNGIAITFCMCLCFMSFIVYGPFVLIRLYDMTPFGAGMVIMVETIGWTIGAIALSGLPARYESNLIRLNSVLLIFAIASMGGVLPSGILWAVVVNAFMINFLFGSMWGFIIKRLIASTGTDDKDRASSLIPTTQQLGFALSAALAGLIANSPGMSETSTDTEIRTIAFWLFAGYLPIVIAGCFAGWRFTSVK